MTEIIKDDKPITDEEKKKYWNNWRNQYKKKRYKEDPEFREKQKAYEREYYKKMRDALKNNQK
jgi:hypothetical protein